MVERTAKYCHGKKYSVFKVFFFHKSDMQHQNIWMFVLSTVSVVVKERKGVNKMFPLSTHTAPTDAIMSDILFQIDHFYPHKIL